MKASNRSKAPHGEGGADEKGASASQEGVSPGAGEAFRAAENWGGRAHGRAALLHDPRDHAALRGLADGSGITLAVKQPAWLESAVSCETKAKLVAIGWGAFSVIMRWAQLARPTNRG